MAMHHAPVAGTHEQTTQHAIDGLVVAKVAADAVHGAPLVVGSVWYNFWSPAACRNVQKSDCC